MIRQRGSLSGVIGRLREDGPRDAPMQVIAQLSAFCCNGSLASLESESAARDWGLHVGRQPLKSPGGPAALPHVSAGHGTGSPPPASHVSHGFSFPIPGSDKIVRLWAECEKETNKTKKSTFPGRRSRHGRWTRLPRSETFRRVEGSAKKHRDLQRSSGPAMSRFQVASRCCCFFWKVSRPPPEARIRAPCRPGLAGSEPTGPAVV